MAGVRSAGRSRESAESPGRVGEPRGWFPEARGRAADPRGRFPEARRRLAVSRRSAPEAPRLPGKAAALDAGPTPRVPLLSSSGGRPPNRGALLKSAGTPSVRRAERIGLLQRTATRQHASSLGNENQLRLPERLLGLRLPEFNQFQIPALACPSVLAEIKHVTFVDSSWLRADGYAGAYKVK